MVTKRVIPDIAKYLQEITARATRHAGRCHRTYSIPYLCPDCKGDNLFFFLILSAKMANVRGGGGVQNSPLTGR